MTISWSGFYAIIDPAHCPTSASDSDGTDVLEVADAVLRGGATVLQLRDKRGDDRDQLALARVLKARCEKVGIPFVMNDRLDLALLAGADGLHLGQDDLPIEDVRGLFRGPVGLSTHNMVQAQEAVRRGADLIGFGPVFSTRTKENPDPTVGIAMLGEVAQAVDVPVVAIGGIGIAQVGAVYETGAAMIAAISAVLGASDPEAAARAFGGRA